MIFTNDEILAFGAELNLVGSALQRAVDQAIAIAEGELGAQRNFEVQRYVDTLRLASSTAYLTHLPVLALPAIEVQLKAPQIGSFGRFYPMQIRQWRSLESTEFDIDYDTGCIEFSAWMNGWCPGAANAEAKIAYSAGFAFQSPLSNAEKTIKQAIAGILFATTGNPNYTQGVTEFNLQNFYQVRYGQLKATSAIETAAGDHLQILQRYRPQALPI